jgi:hypothetical protein
MVTGNVRVGRFEIQLELACDWVGKYTDAGRNRTATDPYAYPAYDVFDADLNDPAVLLDADLLAPGLLNVPVSIRSFYGLQSIRDALQRLLSRAELASPLAGISDEVIADLVGPFYALLDDSKTKPWGVGGTTLSKVLHRKRPNSIGLHDRWVHACYVGEGAPVPRAETRSWADYMTLVAQAMAADLRDPPGQFSTLRRASHAEPTLSDLRVLDILAWSRGQRSAGEEADGEPQTPSP